MTTYQLPRRENALAELKHRALHEGLVTLAERVKGDPRIKLADWGSVSLACGHADIGDLMQALKDYVTEYMFDGEGFDFEVTVDVYDNRIEWTETVVQVVDPDGWGGPTRLIVIEHRLDDRETLHTERQVSYWSEQTTTDDDGNKVLTGLRPYYSPRISDTELANVVLALDAVLSKYRSDAANRPRVVDHRSDVSDDAFDEKLERAKERTAKEYGIEPEDVLVLSDG